MTYYSYSDNLVIRQCINLKELEHFISESKNSASADYAVLSWICCYIHYDELDYSNRFV